ncbi:hypothetical protein BC828DRAFT_381552 [Blastocladiella britannica]|nr:hypothetical protein BC828DRAFT_381552 [Blastocladiella britannica]
MSPSILGQLWAIPVSVAASLYALLATVLPFLPRLLFLQSSSTRLLSGVSTPTHEESLCRYESLYTRDHPRFFRGTYAQLIDAVKNKLEHALVYLHAEDHDDTLRFTRETLAHPDVLAALSGSTNESTAPVNVYLAPMHAAESVQIASLLGAAAFPFLALVTLSSVQGVTRPAVVWRSEGFVDGPTLASQITAAVQTHGLFLATVRRERRDREVEREMRSAQESAYQESLRRDRERAQRQLREAEQKKAAEDVRKTMVQSKADELKARQARRATLRAAYAADPSPTTPLTDASAAPARIRIRLPSGAQHLRSFAPDALVRDVYAYVDSLDPRNEDAEDPMAWAEARVTATGEDADQEEDEEEEEEGVPDFGFLLCDVYPRREFRDLDRTVVDAGLRGGVSLVVEI